MSDDSRSVNYPPFPAGYRASGLLLHVTSLPSPYGIGDVGPGAVKWVDRLRGAGQSWWQVLPLGPTGHGNSPYQSLSSFAGNWILVSPDWLIEDGLLRPGDCAPPSFADTAVDYGTVIPFKHRLLERAWMNFSASGQVSRELMRLAWSSAAALSVAPLQDLLNLGSEARINVPGRAEGNWTWRCTEEMISDPAFDSLRDLTRASNRLCRLPGPPAGERVEAVP